MPIFIHFIFIILQTDKLTNNLLSQYIIIASNPYLLYPPILLLLPVVHFRHAEKTIHSFKHSGCHTFWLLLTISPAKKKNLQFKPRQLSILFWQKKVKPFAFCKKMIGSCKPFIYFLHWILWKLSWVRIGWEDGIGRAMNGNYILT